MHPFALLPIALAASRGRIDGLDASSLVAAGFTLLQRCAPLVRALAGKPSAILLPPSGAFLTALAASDGRSALLLDPSLSAAHLHTRLTDRGVGALFTDRELAKRISGPWPIVTLDEAPAAASVSLPDGRTLTIDLGSHFGLALEGEGEVAGSEEPCLEIATPSADSHILSHRELLEEGRRIVRQSALAATQEVQAASTWAELDPLLRTGIAPLLAGARVNTREAR